MANTFLQLSTKILSSDRTLHALFQRMNTKERITQHVFTTLGKPLGLPFTLLALLNVQQPDVRDRPRRQPAQQVVATEKRHEHSDNQASSEERVAGGATVLAMADLFYSFCKFQICFTGF